MATDKKEPVNETIQKNILNLNISFLSQPIFLDLHRGDVFFKKEDIISEQDQKIFELAVSVNKEGKIENISHLFYILKHHGWEITHNLNTTQIKAIKILNKFKKKVFNEGIKEIYIVRKTN